MKKIIIPASAALLLCLLVCIIAETYRNSLTSEDLTEIYVRKWEKDKDTPENEAMFQAVESYYKCRAALPGGDAACGSIAEIETLKSGSAEKHGAYFEKMKKDCLEVVKSVQFTAYEAGVNKDLSSCYGFTSFRPERFRELGITQEYFCGLASRGIDELCSPENLKKGILCGEDCYITDNCSVSGNSARNPIVEDPRDDPIYLAFANKNPRLCDWGSSSGKIIACRSILDESGVPCGAYLKKAKKTYSIYSDNFYNIIDKLRNIIHDRKNFQN